MPKVSVIMGIYNCADTLDEAIQSILNQTFTDWDLVMCDDGSKDDTYQVAEKYVRQYPGKFILLRNESNQGLNKTLNHCLQAATGEYIARMDGDDISVPERFEKEVAFLDAHPEFAIVSTPMILFDENGSWGQTRRGIEQPTIKDFVNNSPFHCHAPCMIRREAYVAVDGYTVDKRLLRFEDCNLWFKLYAKGYRGYNMSEPLYMMRDDRNASHRRSPLVRFRGLYVLYSGFKLVKMPARFYFALIPKLIRYTIMLFIPNGVYVRIHKWGYRKQSDYGEERK